MNRRQEIIDELNALCTEKDDVGETFIDCVIDSREDEGLPPFSPEELAKAQKECDENAAELTAIAAKMNELRDEYFLLTGKYPIGIGDDIISRFREPFSWEN